MDRNMKTIGIEDEFFLPVFKKIPVSIERGEGVYVFDENGKRYLDFTAGWGVTCIGHASPVIAKALAEQSAKIIQNPESGKTYSPPRAELLLLLRDLLPHGLTRLFFTNSGAEANDAVIKLARKISGKKNVISTLNSFHGRTISTASATGQAYHRDKYAPLMPHYLFVPYDDIDAVQRVIQDDVAAVIVEPIQGEGGIIVPSENYLPDLSALCAENGVHLILDEIQTGFLRTGAFFCSSRFDLEVAFMTMAKGIAGGFPFGAFAVTEKIAEKIEIGDHGGTYCGNPLGCAVARAVISHLIENRIADNVNDVSELILGTLAEWRKEFSDLIHEVRGQGLLIAVEMADPVATTAIQRECLERGLMINVTQGTVIRLFPALTITRGEAMEGMDILKQSLARYA
ncbi:MAG: aspartate aminotransferase family protein [Spirochaetes bacterium]|nr:aspartate aminotransferase family protein [Spirochaetota bacterium]